MSKLVQRAMHCRCGNPTILALGLCATCYTLKRQDDEYFGGLREAVLERDGYRCRVCDASGRDKRSIIVHLVIRCVHIEKLCRYERAWFDCCHLARAFQGDSSEVHKNVTELLATTGLIYHSDAEVSSAWDYRNQYGSFRWWDV